MTVRKKWLISFVILLLILSQLTGCSSNSAPPAQQKEKVITIAKTSDPGTADVQLTTEEYFVPLNIYDRLVEAVTIEPGKSELQPGLAEKWDVSEDGLVYTFYLKKGVKFHNGEELKADDVLYTFDRMLDPKTKALNTDFLNMIDGAQERMDGTADSTRGLKVIDDYTIQITLAQPFAPFIACLSTPAGSIYNRKATEAAGQDFGVKAEATVGTGPFVLSSWSYNDQIVLTANPNYFKGKPDLDKIVAKIVPDAETQRMMFEKGEIDVFDCDNARSQIPYFKNSEKWKNQIISGPRVGVYYYNINQAIEPFDDVKVRKAMQRAINKQLLLDTLYNGTGTVAKGILPPGLIGYNPNLPGIPYDIEAAKSLLTEAGYPNGFQMQISQTVDSPNTLKLNEAVQAMLNDISVKAEIVQMDEAAWFGTRREGKLPMYTTDWSADFNDPDNFMYTFFSEQNSKVRSFNYNNEYVQEGLEKARAITDQNERIALYNELEKIIVYDDAAWIPLFHLDHLFVVQPRVKNFKVSWNGWSDMPYYEVKIEE